MEEALSAVARFDPATASQTFRISGSDYFSTLLMPRLAAAVMPEAPGVTLQMLDHPSSEVVGCSATARSTGGRRGVRDARGFARAAVPVIHRFGPAEAPSAAGRGWRAAGERIPPALFCAIPQVLMSMDGGRAGTIDRALPGTGCSAASR